MMRARNAPSSHDKGSHADNTAAATVTERAGAAQGKPPARQPPQLQSHAHPRPPASHGACSAHGQPEPRLTLLSLLPLLPPLLLLWSSLWLALVALCVLSLPDAPSRSRLDAASGVMCVLAFIGVHRRHAETGGSGAQSQQRDVGARLLAALAHRSGACGLPLFGLLLGALHLRAQTALPESAQWPLVAALPPPMRALVVAPPLAEGAGPSDPAWWAAVAAPLAAWIMVAWWACLGPSLRRPSSARGLLPGGWLLRAVLLLPLLLAWLPHALDERGLTGLSARCGLLPCLRTPPPSGPLRHCIAVAEAWAPVPRPPKGLTLAEDQTTTSESDPVRVPEADRAASNRSVQADIDESELWCMPMRVFYPCDPDAPHEPYAGPYFPATQLAGLARLKLPSWPTWLVESIFWRLQGPELGRVARQGVGGAPLPVHPSLSRPGSAPLMMLQHGYTASGEMLTAVATGLASHGSIVVVPTFVDGSAMAMQAHEVAAAGLQLTEPARVDSAQQSCPADPQRLASVPLLQRISLPGDVNGAPRTESGWAKLAQARVTQAVAALQQLARWHENAVEAAAASADGPETAGSSSNSSRSSDSASAPPSPSGSWQSSMDPSRAVLVGHSFGGAAAVETAEHVLVQGQTARADSRSSASASLLVRCVLLLDPWLFPVRPSIVWRGLGVPVLTLFGEQFMTWSAVSAPTRTEAVLLSLHSAGGSGGVAWLPGMSHYAQMDLGSWFPESLARDQHVQWHATQRELPHVTDNIEAWSPCPPTDDECQPLPAPPLDGLPRLPSPEAMLLWSEREAAAFVATHAGAQPPPPLTPPQAHALSLHAQLEPCVLFPTAPARTAAEREQTAPATLWRPAMAVTSSARGSSVAVPSLSACDRVGPLTRPTAFRGEDRRRQETYWNTSFSRAPLSNEMRRALDRISAHNEQHQQLHQQLMQFAKQKN